MTKVSYENILPTLVENTIMHKILVDDVPKTIRISPTDGFVIHDNRLDDYLIDEETEIPEAEPTAGYKSGSVSVRWDYDFVENQNNIYAISRSSVPEDRIF